MEIALSSLGEQFLRFLKNYLSWLNRIFLLFDTRKLCVFEIFLLRSIKAYLCPNIINSDIVDFSEHRPEEVISFFWSSVYIIGCLEEHMILQGTHHSARRMHLKSWHLLQPITNLSCVCFICKNSIPSKSLSSIITSCNFIYNGNGILNRESFIIHVFCWEQAKRSYCKFSCRAHNNILYSHRSTRAQFYMT